MQGNFFRDKAYEVDEESTQEIFGTKLVIFVYVFFLFIQYLMVCTL